jgi:hypothetical protein
VLALLARPPAVPASVTVPRPERVSSLADALAPLLKDAGGVIAFGEIHQTKATAGTRSALARFTEEILPVLAPRAGHLIIETWVATGDCGAKEEQVTEEVARTTERPAETENEIVRLARRAKELGVAPHYLGIGCKEYEVLAGAGGAVDYDRLLSITREHLERAIRQAALLPRAGARPLVIVYGGALHNDLYPEAALAKYSFGPTAHAFLRGAYQEIDLYVPEMIDAMPSLRGERWHAAWRQAGRGATKRGGGHVVIRRGARSTIMIFPRGN